MASSMSVITSTDLSRYFPLIASGKVRDVYKIDDSTLLFVATDRVSAYDVVLKNGIPTKGAILTLLSAHWSQILESAIPHLHTHFLSLDLPPSIRDTNEAVQLRNRSMQVRRLKVLPVESIVRGYITGSAWSEYQKTGKVHGMTMPKGLRESEKLETPLWTPSTKAEMGDNDENISPEKAAELIGPDYASQISSLSLSLYTFAHTYALSRGIIIADTKFEFALDITTSPSTVVLVDEVLTPDSSRFWPASAYQIGRGQESLDKQILRDWLVKEGLKGKAGVELPGEVVEKTLRRYEEAFERLVGRRFADVAGGVR